MSLENAKITQRLSEPVLLVERDCSFSQLIVTICRNQTEWLTSIGWSQTEKSVPLKCESIETGIAIHIPGHHAVTISEGDVITVTCQELGFVGSVEWLATNIMESGIEPVFQREINFADKQKTSSRKKALILASSGLSILVIGSAGFVFRGNEAALPQQVVSSSVKNTVKTVEAPKKTADFSNDDTKHIASGTKAVIEPEKSEPLDPEHVQAKSKIKEKLPSKAKRIAKKDVIEEQKTAEVKPPKPTIAKPPEVKPYIATTTIPHISDRSPKSSIYSKPAPQALQDLKSGVQIDPYDTVEINSEIQTLLKNMRYYFGEIDGTRSINTLKSVSFFKEIFGIPNDVKIDDRFLERLRVEERKYFQQQKEALRDVEAKIAEDISARPFIESIPAIVPPSTEPSVSKASEAESITAPVASSVPTNPEAEPIIQAEVSPPAALVVPENPVSQVGDTLKGQVNQNSEIDLNGPDSTIYPRAKLLKKARVKYPRLSTSTFNKEVILKLKFDVSPKGRVENVTVLNSNYDGLHYGKFEKAAISAVKSQKFSPGILEGKAVLSSNHLMTINFR